MAQEIKASMAGSVGKIQGGVGDNVTSGDDIVILESMKMEIPIAADADGRIAEVLVNEGDFVNEGDVLARID